jgi:hypothetical protein
MGENNNLDPLKVSEAQFIEHRRSSLSSEMGMELEDISKELSFEWFGESRIDIEDSLLDALKLAASSGFDYGWREGNSFGMARGLDRGKKKLNDQMCDQFFRPFGGDGPWEIRLNQLMKKLRKNVNKRAYVRKLERLMGERHESSFLRRIFIDIHGYFHPWFMVVLVLGSMSLVVNLLIFLIRVSLVKS